MAHLPKFHLSSQYFHSLPKKASPPHLEVHCPKHETEEDPANLKPNVLSLVPKDHVFCSATHM